MKSVRVMYNRSFGWVSEHGARGNCICIRSVCGVRERDIGQKGVHGRARYPCCLVAISNERVAGQLVMAISIKLRESGCIA